MGVEENGKGLSFTDRPSAAHNGRDFTFFYPKPGKPVTCFPLGDASPGVPMHYVGNRSLPCHGAHCRFDHATVGIPIWAGYLPVHVYTVTKPTLVMVRSEVRGALDRIIAAYGALRGLKLRFKRKTPDPRSEILVEVLVGTAPHDLPRWYDPAPLLTVFWARGEEEYFLTVAAAERAAANPRGNGRSAG